jgi:hypothetical protein
MPTFEELDKLGSQELHDRAMKLARHRVDVLFFWNLLKEIPAAEAASGELKEADLDVATGYQQVLDALHTDDDPERLDALRPIYIDYLLKHEK